MTSGAAGTPAHGNGERGLEALRRLSVATATILDPDRLARVALDETLRFLGAERALLFVLDVGEGDRRPIPFVGRVAGGVAGGADIGADIGADGSADIGAAIEADIEAAGGYDSTALRRVVETGGALVVSDADRNPAPGAAAHGGPRIVIAPMRLEGRLSGLLYLDRPAARGAFTEDDAEVLTAIGGHVAALLETGRAARLDLEARTALAQRQLAARLRASVVELGAIVDPPQVLQRLFTTLRTQLRASRGILLHGADDRLTVVGTDGTADSGDLGRDVAVSGDPGLAVLCAATTPTIVRVEEAPAGLRTLLGGESMALVLPLSTRPGRVGLILLGAETFDDTARRVGATFVAQGMSAYDNARLGARVRELATIDELSGTHNRRHFYALANALVEVAIRGGHTLAAVMLDIDNFKAINDTYGHSVGDVIIQEIARRLGASIRHSDVLGRYGGEEFAVILPDHDGHDGELAERMRLAVAATPIPTRSGSLTVTISVGLARLSPVADGLDQLLSRADHALYRAKEGGRNRVEEG